MGLDEEKSSLISPEDKSAAMEDAYCFERLINTSD
jgi:hypothetical protein